jgi:hypothetical protein
VPRGGNSFPICKLHITMGNNALQRWAGGHPTDRQIRYNTSINNICMEDGRQELTLSAGGS